VRTLSDSMNCTHIPKEVSPSILGMSGHMMYTGRSCTVCHPYHKLFGQLYQGGYDGWSLRHIRYRGEVNREFGRVGDHEVKNPLGINKRTEQNNIKTDVN
jgi:hypothetical protein